MPLVDISKVDILISEVGYHVVQTGISCPHQRAFPHIFSEKILIPNVLSLFTSSLGYKYSN